jgi:dienelactone hydrolase
MLGSSMRLLRPILLAFAAVLSLATSAARAEDPRPEIVSINGMVTQVFVPPGKGPFPVVVFSHGRSGTDSRRAELERPIPLGHAGYWLGKGFAVVAPIRPGYGATGGADQENSGARWDAQGQCAGAPGVSRAIGSAAAAVREALDWTRAQSWAKRDRIILAGQSVGGITSVVLGGQNPPGVVAIINFSGGAAGNPTRHPGQSCGVEDVAAVYAAAGRRARAPSLWLYAANDQYWGQDAPRRWHAAYAQGGSRSKFVMTAPVPDSDGHNLMRRGGRLWSEHVNPFVASLGL